MYRFFKEAGVAPYVALVIEPSAIPDRVSRQEETVLLYKEDRLVGVNFMLDYPSFKKGMNAVVKEEDLLYFNKLLEKYGEKPLLPLPHSGFAIAEVTKIEEHPLDEKKSIVKLVSGPETYETITSYSLELGQKVVVALDKTILADGSLFEKTIDHNIKVDVLILSGRLLNENNDESRPFEPLNGNSGDDYFLKK